MWKDPWCRGKMCIRVCGLHVQSGTTTLLPCLRRTSGSFCDCREASSGGALSAEWLIQPHRPSWNKASVSGLRPSQHFPPVSMRLTLRITKHLKSTQNYARHNRQKTQTLARACLQGGESASEKTGTAPGRDLPRQQSRKC